MNNYLIFYFYLIIFLFIYPTIKTNFTKLYPIKRLKTKDIIVVDNLICL
jgi:hypothetical protein